MSRQGDELTPNDICSNFEQSIRTHTLPLLRRILKLLDAGYYPAKIAELLGKSRSTISYHLKKMERAGLIEPLESIEKLKDGLYRAKIKGIIKLYRLTQACSSFLARIEARVFRGRVIRLHNAYFKYPILVQPRIRIDWRRVEMTNWTQLLGRELGLVVRKNPRSLEIIARVVEGRDPYKLLFLAKSEADNLASHLEQKFSMVLGRGDLSRKPHFGVYDSVAAKVGRVFELTVDVAKIDESEGIGEIDWFSPEDAKEYLLMPGMLRRMSADVEEIKSGQRLFNEGMLEHMKLIKGVQGLANELKGLVKELRKIRRSGDSED